MDGVFQAVLAVHGPQALRRLLLRLAKAIQREREAKERSCPTSRAENNNQAKSPFPSNPRVLHATSDRHDVLRSNKVFDTSKYLVRSTFLVNGE